jgi:hypothetical protein
MTAPTRPREDTVKSKPSKKDLPRAIRRIPAHQSRRVAVLALCCTRTVDRVYAGLPVRQMTAMRILEAIEKLGLPTPPPQITR